MRKPLFIALLLAGTTVARAQDLQLGTTMDVVTGSISVVEDNELDVHWDVINGGSSTLVVRAKRNVTEEVAGSRNRFCWGPLCYDYATDQSSTNTNLMVTMDPAHVESTFHGYYEHQGYAGHTIVEYCFFENGNEENEVCHTVHYCVDDECIISAVDENEGVTELGMVSPNPLTSRGILTYSFAHMPENARIVFYNLVGDIVRVVNLDHGSGAVFLDSGDFQPGVYFYTLEGNGGVLATKKLVVSR